MKAYKLMMGMFFFNVAFIIYNSLGIWNTGFGRSDISVYTEEFAILVILATAGTLAAAAATAKLFPYAQHGVIYVAFAGMYLFMAGTTFSILRAMAQKLGAGATLMVDIFMVVVVITLVIAIYQMVTGGWKSFV